MPKGVGYGAGAGNLDTIVELALQDTPDASFNLATPADTGVLMRGLPEGSATMDYQNNPSYKYGGEVKGNRPNYQMGGVVAPEGDPRAAGLSTGGPPPPVPPQQMQMEIQRFVQEHPQQVMQIKQAVMQAVQSGELTQQELNMAVQLATAAAQDPQLYPQIRKFAIEQGLATEQELPMEYDQGLVFVLLLAAQAAQSAFGGQGTPQSQGQPPQAAMALGGVVPDSRNTDGSVAINAHEGEVVIHPGVVKAKGTEFFERFNKGYNLDGSPITKA
tara:strand:+ start:5304 stop:6122 length:819 start_codon:yes stop_codon:yes gene_type:complete